MDEKGVLLLQKKLDREKKDYYDLILYAEDDGESPNGITAHVYVS